MQHSASVLLNRLLARGKFRHVQVLLKLAELGSVQRTADSISVTQSSVTQTLAYLERLLGLQLFERHARGVRPTAACRDLLPVARQVLLGISEGAELVAARQNHGQGSVRLVASVAATHGLLINALPQFGLGHPGIQVTLTEAEGDDQLLAIARGEADMVACRRPPVIPEGWAFTPLLEDWFTVLCRAGHPLAPARRLSWDDLADATWLLTPAGTAARTRFDELASSFGHPPFTHSIVTRSPTMMWWLLRHDDALAFLPLNFVQPLIEAGEVLELDARLASPIEPLGLLAQVTEPSEAARVLGSYLTQHFAKPRAMKDVAIES